MQEYKIIYSGITPNISNLRLRQQLDNSVYKIVFEIDKLVFGVDLAKYTPYVKVDTSLLCTAEKAKLEAKTMENKLVLDWDIKNNVSQWNRVNVQLSFEDIINGNVLNTKVITLFFDKSINADKEIEEAYPTVIQDYEKRLQSLEGQSHIEQFENYLAFPTSGNENICYVDKKDNKLYRWDSKDLKYYCIGSDYNQIEIVNGGNL